MLTKLSFLATALCLASTLPQALKAQEAEVISTSADVTVTTSLCSSWETLEAVNDGQVGANSKTRPSGGIYGNWSSPDTYNWVMYQFPYTVVMTEAAVYWFTDDGGLLIPTEAYIEYYDETTNGFVKAGDIGTEADMFNTLSLPNVVSDRIRITMYHPEQSTGIVEFQVKGFVPETTPFASYGSSVDDGDWEEGVAHQTVAQGSTVSYAAIIDEDDATPGTWAWSGPSGFTSSDSALVLTDVTSSQTGTYTVTFTNSGYGRTQQSFSLTVYDGEVGAEYTWKEYIPSLNYDFREEYPDFQAPTQDLEEFEVAGRISDGWWTYAWGPKANYLGTDQVGEEGIRNMLDRMNTDFAYFRDSMGWPPDLRARSGYRSTIYLYGSGLPTDNADSTATGGWQSATTYNGITYPMVLLSYYPVYSFHPNCPYTTSDKDYQTGAVVHEGIHALLADLPGCKNSAWIQEGGNTWLQQEYESRTTGDYSELGYLNAPALIAPFMPIECYSGWLLDGSFGGPAAEGVNVYDESGQQLCNWRNLLGGTQYGSLFVVFLGQTLGDGIVPWIWANCPSRVLEGMGDSLGSDQMRRLIIEYRAKQAMLDFGDWTDATKKLLNDNFNVATQQEYAPYTQEVEVWNMTPYVSCTQDGNGLVTPAELTLPGWSGANQIPLHIENKDTVLIVDFQPIGENMSLQLCYRTRAGKIVYGTPVPEGECVLNIPSDERPANEVVIAVVCNTDYIYEGEETRTAKYDYRLNLKRGVYHTANPYIKWYEYGSYLYDRSFTGVEEVEAENNLQFTLSPSMAHAGENIRLSFSQEPENAPVVRLISLNGTLLLETTTDASGQITLPASLESGLYLISATQGGKTETAKLVVH